MSLKTLPILFINLGGEMLYILDQRLRAQNIPKEKASKVMHDITATMFNKRFMDELFKPQELYSKKALRTVFDRLAHASIMRLNTASMDKLYDLMTMAFKYQVSLCLRPNDVLLATLNHMDTIRDFVEESATIRGQVEHVYRLLAQHYASMSPGEFMLMRQTLLNFFQDMHIRVSIFLRDKVQGQNGRFVLPVGGPVPYGTQVPGSIKIFDGSGQQVGKKAFHPGGNFQECKRQGSYDTCGDRVTKLGSNMYSGHHKPLETNFSSGGSAPKAVPSSEADLTPNPMAKAHLDLLAKLIGGGGEKDRKGSTEFRLNLFQTDQEEEQAAVLRPNVQEEGSQIVNIDATNKKQDQRLARIMGELTVGGASSSQGDDDLLELMDSAS